MELNDRVLAEYCKLLEEVKSKNRWLEEIKSACKDRGSFATSEYVCTVEKQQRQALPGLDVVCQSIQRDTLEVLGLIKTIQVVTVRIGAIQPITRDLLLHLPLS